MAAGSKAVQKETRLGAPSTLKHFPTDQEIEAFQAQLNSESIKSLAEAFKNSAVTSLKQKIPLSTFQKFLNENFENSKPAESLVVAMFERFKPFRLDGVREETQVATENTMDVLDFIIAMNLLARIVYEKKLKLLFWVCDDDGDGCMTPEDILDMLKRVKRVFASECARVDLESATLNNLVADKKSEINFHLIMGKIETQNQQRDAKLKQQSEEAKGTANKNMRDEPSNPADEEEEGSLITYREFINAIKSDNLLYKNILPRTLSFKEVLSARKYEPVYRMSDMHADNFAMFRYELNSIFRQHQFTNEVKTELYMGRNPLSKTDTGK